MSEDKPAPPVIEQKITPPTLLDTIFSVLASFFGVQSREHRVRDFSSGKPMVFIGVAIVLTIVFVLTLVLIVKLILRNAGV